ncbi:MAG: hypothetical protein IPP41_10680 [Rhodocyclaceae bacterium]|nr:hypothetical protein [Rhodocyclaceae bacterium]
MGKTSALIELETRIGDIETTLLPKVNPLGFYTEAEQDSIRAFVLLCHAEFECFIEDLARLLNATLTAESTNAKAGGKFARYHANKTSIRVAEAINTNHGLKAANLLSMFGLFGFSEADFDAIDPKFLTQMNAFGSRRGESAHGSAKRAKKQPSPIEERLAVQQILEYLSKFEAELIRVRLIGFLNS